MVLNRLFTRQWLKQHLSTLVINSLDRILVSPYVRAQETFHQVNQAFDLELENKFEIWEGLRLMDMHIP